MRLTLGAFCLVIFTNVATAQTQNEDKKPGDSPHSTGLTVLPDNKGELQPGFDRPSLNRHGRRQGARQFAPILSTKRQRSILIFANQLIRGTSANIDL
jgi:hypothetical protein